VASEAEVAAAEEEEHLEDAEHHADVEAALVDLKAAKLLSLSLTVTKVCLLREEKKMLWSR